MNEKLEKHVFETIVLAAFFELSDGFDMWAAEEKDHYRDHSMFISGATTLVGKIISKIRGED